MRGARPSRAAARGASERWSALLDDTDDDGDAASLSSEADASLSSEADASMSDVSLSDDEQEEEDESFVDTEAHGTDIHDFIALDDCETDFNDTARHMDDDAGDGDREFYDEDDGKNICQLLGLQAEQDDDCIFELPPTTTNFVCDEKTRSGFV